MDKTRYIMLRIESIVLPHFQLFSHPVRAAMQIYEQTESALADSASTRAFTERIDNVITAMMARTPASALRPSEHCQNKKV